MLATGVPEFGYSSLKTAQARGLTTLLDLCINSEPLIQIVDGSGLYEFRNLAPGKYILEIDSATLPEDFRLPVQMSWPSI